MHHVSQQGQQWHKHADDTESFKGLSDIGRPLSFYGNASMRIILIVALTLGSMQMFAQSPQRLPITTGFSSGYQVVPAGTTIWIADQSSVYRRDPVFVDRWQALPTLYRCEPASIVAASSDRVTVAAERRTQADTAWWLFQSAHGAALWSDSVQFRPEGRLLCGAWGYVLFSATGPDEAMVVDVYDRFGDKRGSIQMAQARNSRALTIKQCGDSVILLDRSTGATTCEVIRGSATTPVASWTRRDVAGVIAGVIGWGDAFVFQTSAGVFVDHAGVVRPVLALGDRLNDLYIDSLRAARIGRGGVEVAWNITTSAVELVRDDEMLTPSTDRVIALPGMRDIVVGRTGGRMDLLVQFFDANAQPQWRTIPFIRGSRSKGPRHMLSGANVIVADNFTETHDFKSRAAVCTVVPGPTACDTTLVRAVSRTHEMLRSVGDDVWFTTPDGVITYPNLDTIRQLPVYDVVDDRGRIVALSSRGIEVRDVGSDTFRVLVPGELALGVAAAGDTIFAFQTKEITTIDPEAQIVVNAYDRFGSPYFVQRVVADSILSRGLRFRSVSKIDGRIVVNCSRTLASSVDAAVTWSEQRVDGEFMTGIDAAGQYPVVWIRTANGTQGPALMIQPNRWIMQPMELQTNAPVIACAYMPGWFVFSTSDGVWCVKQTISSVAGRNVDEESQFTDRTPDEERLFDLRGRSFSRETAPRGAYFHAVRFGDRWILRQPLHIP